ncbi:MAG: hypothetical protein VXV85_08085, partial [Candidatus Thermoplasmatota archaeon]|nr:hypothetical protein [Candidatus Thermoplasmatota archaeon]
MSCLDRRWSFWTLNVSHRLLVYGKLMKLSERGRREESQRVRESESQRVKESKRERERERERESKPYALNRYVNSGNSVGAWPFT